MRSGPRAHASKQVVEASNPVSRSTVGDHLHRAGVAVLFADERLPTSDPDHWPGSSASLEAEAHSRKLSKRVHELRGGAPAPRRLGVSGGSRAPVGTIRELPG